jgi:hypothetical protein
MDKCDKCREPATAAVSCPGCGANYRRCDECGGESGAKRSLHSHRALAAGGKCEPPIDQRRAQAARTPNMGTAGDGRTFLFMGQPDHEERFERGRIYDGTGDDDTRPIEREPGGVP